MPQLIALLVQNYDLSDIIHEIIMTAMVLIMVSIAAVLPFPTG